MLKLERSGQQILIKSCQINEILAQFISCNITYLVYRIKIRKLRLLEWLTIDFLAEEKA